MDPETAKSATLQASVPGPSSQFQIRNSAIICPALGCLGWLALIPFLVPLRISDPLTQLFGGFFNLILIGVIGSHATILSLVGWFRSLQELKAGNQSVGIVGKRLSIVAFVLGLGIVFMYLPSPLVLFR